MLQTAIHHFPGLVVLIPFGSPVALKVFIELMAGTAVTVRRMRFRVYHRDEDTSEFWWVVLLQVGYLCVLTWFSIFKRLNSKMGVTVGESSLWAGSSK